MAKCRTCEAPVEWALMESGKMMPLDAVPSKDGRFVFIGGKARLETLEDRALARPVYTSHFVTCPDRDLHRKK